MSFLGGAECSTTGNPLSQFTKHVQDDKSLQRDRLVGGESARQFESIRNQRPIGQHDKASTISYSYRTSKAASSCNF